MSKLVAIKMEIYIYSMTRNAISKGNPHKDGQERAELYKINSLTLNQLTTKLAILLCEDAMIEEN